MKYYCDLVLQRNVTPTRKERWRTYEHILEKRSLVTVACLVVVDLCKMFIRKDVVSAGFADIDSVNHEFTEFALAILPAVNWVLTALRFGRFPLLLACCKWRFLCRILFFHELFVLMLEETFPASLQNTAGLVIAYKQAMLVLLFVGLYFRALPCVLGVIL